MFARYLMTNINNKHTVHNYVLYLLGMKAMLPCGDDLLSCRVGY